MLPHHFAGLFVALVTVAVCFWAGLRLRQPERQFLGSFSLLVLLSAWGLAFAVSIFFVGDGAEPPPLVPMLAGLIVIGGTLLSVVLAIVGLSLWRGRAPQISRGKRSAIFSIVANALLLSVVMVSAMLAAGGPGSGRKARAGGSSGTGAERIELADQNFSVAPGTPWFQLPNPENVNPEACLVMRIARPEMWAMAIVEEVGDMKVEAYEDLTRSNYLAMGAPIGPEPAEKVEIGGVTFRRMTTTGSVMKIGKKIPITYESWVSVHEARAYQFTFWSPPNKEKLEEKARSFMAGFRSLGKPLVTSLQDFDAPGWGVSASLASLGWSDWEGGEVDAPHACFRATRAFCALQVIPLRWDNEVLDPEAAKAALLGLMDFEYPLGVEGQKGWSDPDSEVSGHEYSARRTVDGTETYYHLRVAAEGRLSWLVAAWTVGDPQAHAGALKEAMDAIKLSPGEGDSPENGPRTAALAFNNAGLHHYTAARYDKAAGFFRQASEKDKTDPIFIGNLVDSLDEMDRDEEALSLLAELPENLAESDSLRLKQALLLVSGGKPLEADALFRKLHTAGSLDENGAYAWVRSLLGAEENAAALEAARTYATAKPGTKTRGWLAEAMESNDDANGALALLGELVEENPHQHELRLDLAEMSNRADRPAEAEALAAALIEEGRDGLRARLALGYSYMNRRWYRQAKEAFEEALKFSPQDESTKELIADASALLGQGENSGIKERIEPVAIPASLEAWLAEIAPEEPTGNHHARYLRYLTGWHFVAGEAFRQTSRLEIEILDAAGVTKFSSLQFTFDPTFERIHVNRLEVFDGDGKQVAAGNVDDFYVLDTPGNAADDGKTLHLPVPGLAAGHRIDAEVTREYLQAPDEIPFERMMFGAGIPIVAEAFFITGEPSAVRARLRLDESVEKVSAEGVRAWLVKRSVWKTLNFSGARVRAGGPGIRSREFVDTSGP